MMGSKGQTPLQAVDAIRLLMEFLKAADPLIVSRLAELRAEEQRIGDLAARAAALDRREVALTDRETRLRTALAGLLGAANFQ